jgi:hypothetical protein
MRRLFILLLVLGLSAGCGTKKPIAGGGSKTASAAPTDGGSKDDDNTPAVHDEKAVAVIEAAINAHGGADALARARVGERKVKGKQLAGGELPFTAETTYELPNRYRDSVTLEIGEQKNHRLVIVNGDKGWIQLEGETVEMPPEQVKDIKDELYVWNASTLVPLKESGVVLALQKEEMVKGKPATVVRAVRSGHPNLMLYFDKASGLLVKIRRRASDNAVKETYYSDHQDVNGVKVAGHEREDQKGTWQNEWTLESIRFPASINAAMFARP